MAFRAGLIGRFEGQSFVAQCRAEQFDPPKDYPGHHHAPPSKTTHRPPTPPADYKQNIFSIKLIRSLEKGNADLLGNRPVSPPIDYERAADPKQIVQLDDDVMQQASKHMDNPAFVHHIRSHQLLAQTTRGHKSLDNCPICKAMHNDGHLHSNDTHGSASSTRSSDKSSIPQSSPSAKVRPSVLNAQIFHPQEPNPLEQIKMIESKGAMALRAKHDREAHSPNELTVTRGQILEACSLRQAYYDCMDAFGNKGLVPREILEKA